MRSPLGSIPTVPLVLRTARRFTVPVNIFFLSQMMMHGFNYYFNPRPQPFSSCIHRSAYEADLIVKYIDLPVIFPLFFRIYLEVLEAILGQIIV